jgi:hypothetical protein
MSIVINIMKPTPLNLSIGQKISFNRAGVGYIVNISQSLSGTDVIEVCFQHQSPCVPEIVLRLDPAWTVHDEILSESELKQWVSDTELDKLF